MYNPPEKKTEGINITDWPIQLREGEDVRLHIWDFAGQEILHGTHQFFLTQRSLYLLVLSGREGHEDADAEYWLSLINSFAADSPVIVVLNKIREQHFTLNRRELQRNFPNVRDFVETDCADPASGIDVLDAAIRRETNLLRHLRDALPTAWFQIKDRLAGMDENYITFDNYREICRGFQEADPQSQESLAFYLHSLGIALNYKEDPRLRDTNVLNPRWVTSGIYRIIEKFNEKSESELRLSHLEAILASTDYPRDRHVFLLELMRKFELCFRFPESEDHYLVPNLLAVDSPAEADTFSPDASLNFEYRYPVLPEGLLPRFIVRTYVLSEGCPRWRHGVILNFEGNRALVRADRVQKQVRISIAGPQAGRQRLLAVIRSDFAHIHRDYTFQPQEMVPVPGHPDVVVPYADLLAFERAGIMSFPVRVDGGRVIVLVVKELLGAVDLRRGVRPPIEPEALSRGFKIFYSYAHEDEDLRDELETHLKIFEWQGLIESWHDRRIPPGTEWKGQIDAALERADLILLLVSADFIASDYIHVVEMRGALERHDAGAARVIPIIVRDCKWQYPPLNKLQALPRDGQAVCSWSDRDSAWRDVADGIEKALEELRGMTDRRRFDA